MKQVLVTGGTGFIGRHLVARLLDQGTAVRCLVRRDPGQTQLGELPVECVRGDLHDASALRSAVTGVDTVFHLAGLTHAVRREQLQRTNAGACGALADACREQSSPPRLVYVSSLAAAGPSESVGAVRSEGHACAPVSDYGRSKRGGEVELQRRAGDLPCTVIRPGIVLGPYDRAALPMFRSVFRQRMHVVVGTRTPPLAIIGVGDLVELLIEAARRGETLRGAEDGAYDPQGYYFACDDREYPTYADLGRMIARGLDRAVLVCPVWQWVGRGVAGVSQTASRLRGRSSILNLDKIREATVASWACSSGKARQQLEFSPRYDLQQWITRTGQWYREQSWL